MKQLYDAALVREFAAAVRRLTPEEWSRAAQRRRAAAKSPAVALVLAHLVVPVLAGLIMNVVALHRTMDSVHVLGFTALALTGAAVVIAPGLKRALAAAAPRDALLLAPVPASFIAGVKAALVGRGTRWLLADVAVAWIFAALIATWVRSGGNPGAMGRGAVAGLGSALPAMMLGFLAALLPGTRLRHLGTALSVLLGGLVALHGYVYLTLNSDWPLPLEFAAGAAEVLPQAILIRWAAEGGDFPFDAAALCLACGLTVVPVLWRLLRPRAPDKDSLETELPPEGLNFSAELAVASLRRMRRREELELNAARRDEAPDEESQEAWDDTEPLMFHPEAPPHAQSRLRPQYRAALTNRARQLLESQTAPDAAAILLQAVPSWEYSWRRIVCWLKVGGVATAILLGLWYASERGAPVAAVIVFTILPLMALTPFRVSAQPAFQMITPGPGAAVPLYAWLPVGIRMLWRGCRAAERRSLLSGLIFAVLLSAMIQVAAFALAAGFRAAGYEPPAPVSQAASVYGIGSSLQFAVYMAGLLHVLRSISPLRFATSALPHFRHRGLWGFARLLFALFCLLTVAASIVAMATGVGAAAVAMEKPRYLRFCIYSLFVSELFRAAAGEVMILLATGARGEFSASRAR